MCSRGTANCCSSDFRKKPICRSTCVGRLQPQHGGRLTSKFDYARQLSPLLAYIALADLDRVSVNAFAQELLGTFPLTRGKQRIVSLLRFLEELRPVGHDTDLRRVSDAFVHRTTRTGLTVIVSDFFDPRGFQEGLDQLRYYRHEPHLVQLYDLQEADPVLHGELDLIDLETEARRTVTVSARNRKEYRRLFSEFLESVQAYARQQGLGCVQAATSVPFDDLICDDAHCRKC